jgi:hypothetical protein
VHPECAVGGSGRACCERGGAREGEYEGVAREEGRAEGGREGEKGRAMEGGRARESERETL